MWVTTQYLKELRLDEKQAICVFLSTDRGFSAKIVGVT